MLKMKMLAACGGEDEMLEALAAYEEEDEYDDEEGGDV